MFDMYAVIEELRKVNPEGFANINHLKFETAYAIKRFYPNAVNIAVDWNKFGDTLDLCVEIDNKRIGFHLFYLDTEEYLNLNQDIKVLTKEQLLNLVVVKTRMSYWGGVEHIEQLMQKKDIDEGFTLLITNSNEIFKKARGRQKDFDLSDGEKDGNRHLILAYETGAPLMLVDIISSYELKHFAYNKSGFNYLVLETEEDMIRPQDTGIRKDLN